MDPEDTSARYPRRYSTARRDIVFKPGSAIGWDYLSMVEPTCVRLPAGAQLTALHCTDGPGALQCNTCTATLVLVQCSAVRCTALHCTGAIVPVVGPPLGGGGEKMNPKIGIVIQIFGVLPGLLWWLLWWLVVAGGGLVS